MALWMGNILWIVAIQKFSLGGWLYWHEDVNKCKLLAMMNIKLL